MVVPKEVVLVVPAHLFLRFFFLTISFDFSFLLFVSCEEFELDLDRICGIGRGS